MTFEPKRICCLLDGDHLSGAPLDVAVSLALRYGAELALLHLGQAAHLLSGEDLAACGLSRGEAAAIGAAASERLFTEARSIADRAGVRVGGNGLRECLSDQEVLDFLRVEAIDLLVLGGGDPHEPLGTLFRTHAERLVHKALCPALMVRQPARASLSA